MDVFIYFPPSSGVERDALEDALDDLLGDRGEVTGGGSGVTGSNLDVEIHEDDPGIVDEIVAALVAEGVPAGTSVVSGRAASRSGPRNERLTDRPEGRAGRARRLRPVQPAGERDRVPVQPGDA